MNGNTKVVRPAIIAIIGSPAVQTAVTPAHSGAGRRSPANSKVSKGVRLAIAKNISAAIVLARSACSGSRVSLHSVQPQR